MTVLNRRLAALEQTAWERRKRQIIRDAFADGARDRQWTPDEFERKVQEILDDFKRIEPELKAMCRQGKTLRDVGRDIAADSGVDVDELLAEAARRGAARSAWRDAGDGDVSAAAGRPRVDCSPGGGATLEIGRRPVARDNGARTRPVGRHVAPGAGQW